MTTQTTEQALEAFSTHYHYDVSYMRHMLALSLDAFEKFAALTALSEHCEAAPLEASCAAKLLGALAEDCGPYLQLMVKMAREAGMPADQVAAVLTAAEEAMTPEPTLGYRFADAVVRRSAAMDPAREVVVDAWGEAAVLDLTLGLQIGRIFPVVKVGLGFAKTCQRVEADSQPVTVVRRAA